MVDFIEFEGRLLKEVEGVEIINGKVYEEATQEEKEAEIEAIENEITRLESRLLILKPAEPTFLDTIEDDEDSAEEDFVEEKSEETPQY